MGGRKNYFLCLPRVWTDSLVWPIRSDETLRCGISRLRHCDPKVTWDVKNSYKLCTRYGRSWWLFGFFLIIILARNIDCKSILQKTLNQFGLVASKYERKSRYKSNFQCVLLRRRICFNMSSHVFLQSALQFGFLSSKPCLFPVESSLEFVIHRGKPSLLICRLNSPPIDQSFSSVLRPEVSLERSSMPARLGGAP